jgi:hypothetical protein
LGDALRAFVAHRARIEAAFLPNDPGEELDRQLVLGGVLFERAADIVGSRGMRCGAATWFCGVLALGAAGATALGAAGGALCSCASASPADSAATIKKRRTLATPIPV